MDIEKEDNDFFDEIEEDVFGGELKKKSKTKWFIIGVCLVLIVALFVYVRFFLIQGRFLNAIKGLSAAKLGSPSKEGDKLPVVEHPGGLPVNEAMDDQNKDMKSLQVNSTTTMPEEVNVSNPDPNLPVWNLGPLYSSISDQNIKTDLANIVAGSDSVAKMIDTIDFASAEALIGAIKKVESTAALVSKLMAFSTLLRSVNASDPQTLKLHSQVMNVVASFSSTSAVFENRLARHLKDHDIENLIAANPALKEYKYYISGILRRKSYMLSDETEKYIAMSEASRSIWSSLFDKTLSGMTFDVDQQKGITVSQILSLASHPDRNTRLKASAVFSQGLGQNSEVVVSIYNAIVRNYITDSLFRGFKSPISARNLSNDVEDSVVGVLIETVKQNYSRTSHRYYAIKSKLLGLEKMHYSDRLAPMPFASQKQYSWDEAKEIILSSFAKISPDFSKMAQDFFDSERVHAVVKKDKESGAFCLSPYVAKPFVLMNYMGRQEDVSTLAHELGHGIHGMLSMKQSYLNSSPPLTLAETASLFGEKLVAKLFSERAKDMFEKASLLAINIEKMLNSVNRQIAFVDFETRVFDQSREGDLTKDEISKIWMDVQKESLGEAFSFDDNYQNYWMYVSHFFHYPFYVYSYAFADLLVNSLFKIYEEKRIPDFETKYIQLLSMGGSDNYKKLLEAFGVNPSDPEFWQKGMDSLIEMIDEFEKLTSSEEFNNALQALKKTM